MKKWIFRKIKADKRKKEILDLTVDDWLEGTKKVGYITSFSFVNRGKGLEYKWME